MKLAIASTAIEAILAHSAAAAPNEACGLLLGAPGTVERAEPAANVAAHPERSFEIDPAALLRWHREARGAGLAVIGHYHSHPNGLARPSATDAARAVVDGAVWVIAAAVGSQEPPPRPSPLSASRGGREQKASPQSEHERGDGEQSSPSPHGEPLRTESGEGRGGGSSGSHTLTAWTMTATGFTPVDLS
ncbi:Mov34/MPN/PAD-1 family protein [Glacieibacterium sp.]|uniref:Mov34/MPN/PAD-1 family protein n=1 Tax=Glacieibacterium sp. TaxID=2860237 RepID=UPI003B006FC1